MHFASLVHFAACASAAVLNLGLIIALAAGRVSTVRHIARTCTAQVEWTRIVQLASE